MIRRIRLSLALILTLLATLPVLAAPPQTINYQGYLTNPGGTPTNMSVVMTFRLYNAVSGGTALYMETQPSVAVSNGSFNAVIGTVTPIPLPFDVPYWLSVQVNADAEMSPRQPLASSPYAFRAASVDAAATIAGAQITGSIAGATLPATQITGTINAATANTVSGSVAGSQITGAITSATIGGAQITGTINAPGNIVLPQSTSLSVGNIMKGAAPFIHNFGSQNTFIGENAGNFGMTGIGNTASGFAALRSNTSGNFNTASGSSALASHTTGTANTANGSSALYANTTGNSNTASGVSALAYNTTGNNNTANGSSALYANTTGNNSTAIGYSALYANTTGFNNTASGYSALTSNTTGRSNTASGADALYSNSNGSQNNASGDRALFSNTTGSGNTASGSSALFSNTIANGNTASGFSALHFNTTGYDNTASGYEALNYNSTGFSNTASGAGALYSNATGNNNTAIGINAGYNQTIGSGNIYIGNEAISGESNTIRIGSGGGLAGNHLRFFAAGIRGVTTGFANAIPVMIDGAGQLGTTSSSRRVKDHIADMNDTSNVLMNLRPVTFYYKSDMDPAGRTLQYGLIAEEVAEIAPGLVAHSANGEVETVFYQHLPPMLLNEFQKQQRTIAAQASELAQQRARIAELEKRSAEVETLKRDMLNIKALLGAN